MTLQLMCPVTFKGSFNPTLSQSLELMYISLFPFVWTVEPLTVCCPSCGADAVVVTGDVDTERNVRIIQN